MLGSAILTIWESMATTKNPSIATPNAAAGPWPSLSGGFVPAWVVAAESSAVSVMVSLSSRSRSHGVPAIRGVLDMCPVSGMRSDRRSGRLPVYWQPVVEGMASA